VALLHGLADFAVAQISYLQRATDLSTQLDVASYSGEPSLRVLREIASSISLHPLQPFCGRPDQTVFRLLAMTMPRQVDLARQVEYYFTKRNLSTDTYLQRLRQLNDGCVPISILANFGRVRAMVISSSSNRENAIVEAINRHSTSLAVYAVNTTTGKRRTGDLDAGDHDDSCGGDGANRSMAIADSHSSPNLTILTVGLAVCDEHPPDSVGLTKEGTLDITDTIILRDVHPTVNEAEIRSLFEAIDECPSVTKICADVAQCW
jgi:La domain